MLPEWVRGLELRECRDALDEHEFTPDTLKETSDSGVLIHWFWPAQNEFETEGTPFDSGEWYHHETTIGCGSVEEKFGTTVFNSKKIGIPEELAPDEINELPSVDVETVRERWRKTGRYDIRSELDLDPPRAAAAATDGGTSPWPPSPIEDLIEGGHLDRHDWPEVFSPELLQTIREGDVGEIHYLKESRDDTEDECRVHLWEKPECLIVEQLLRHNQNDLAVGPGNDKYSGPLFAYSRERNWKLGVTGYRPSSPINVVWKNSSTTNSVKKVANRFTADDWIRLPPLISQNRYTLINVEDSSGKSHHSAEIERTKGVDLLIPTKQYHIRLFETKGTDHEHLVVGQVHCDPLDHGLISRDEPLWKFNEMREKVLEQWRDNEFEGESIAAGNNDCFAACDGRQGRIIGLSGS